MVDQDTIDTAFKIMRAPALCYLTTINLRGVPETRAMINLWNENNFQNLHSELSAGDFTSYLCTHSSTRKVAQILNNPNGGVYVQEGIDAVYIGGTLEIISDPVLKQHAWDSGLNWDMKFDKGHADPEYALIKLNPVYVKLYANLTDIFFEV